MKNTLFILAHPDDETMIGYALDRCLTEGNVWVIVATDGTASSINRRLDPDFVSAGHRRQESEASLLHYGVARDHQRYLELPDSRLSQYRNEMKVAISDLIEQYDIDRVVTLGENGYDGHPDHAATHEAAVAAAQPRHLEIWVLNATHHGALRIEATPELRARKLAGMAQHVSQFPLQQGSAEGLHDAVQLDDFYPERAWWEDDFAVYHPLILTSETFDVMR